MQENVFLNGVVGGTNVILRQNDESLSVSERAVIKIVSSER